MKPDSNILLCRESSTVHDSQQECNRKENTSLLLNDSQDEIALFNALDLSRDSIYLNDFAAHDTHHCPEIYKTQSPSKKNRFPEYAYDYSQT